MDLLVGRYRWVRTLGRGAMGEVWLAEDTRLARPVAIKQLRAGGDGQFGERMRREARVAAQLNHPNAVAVYDLVIDEAGQPYVIMEYVAGDTLADRIRAAGRLPVPQAGGWAAQVAGALAAAHGAGIVHRDVKPANILITPDGSAKLADFGIARSVQEVSATQTGLMIGTPAFLAPEVARGGDPTPAGDMWALGATLYAAVEGRPPYGSANDNPMALLVRIQTEAPAPPQHAGELLGLLGALLQHDPAARPTAAQTQQALARYAANPLAAPPPSQPPPYSPPAHEPSAYQPSVYQPSAYQPSAYQPSYPPTGYQPVPLTPAPRRRSRGGWIAAGALLIAAAVAGGIVLVAQSGSSPSASPTSTPPPAPASTSSSPDFPSTRAAPVSTSAVPPTSPTARPTPTVFPKPHDVPTLPSAATPVPAHATPPARPANPAVRPYAVPDPTPATASQLVEWQPTTLTADETAAVRSVTTFLLAINAQNMQAAWSNSTEARHRPTPDGAFTGGYATSRHYQVAFGQPRRLQPDLIAIPARFVSRQNPAAQGSPAGVTGCTYWPQYVFLVANVGGHWLDDVAADYVNAPSVAPLKRFDAVRNSVQLEPLTQRVPC